ncbi:hypothetical protein D9757_001148 [Collybiopsis confluens]|uniref:Oxidoreductase AflY n=1 Tax=Collybiopsis confluens TaxID=2823264 RepID=A0A8H5I0Y6_9AGAR|nr:hypothetical protein D9757_001148 [Collybiopsis confluens]
MPSNISYRIRRNGVLNLPRGSSTSKTVAEALLEKDVEQHHLYFNTSQFHNHLAHHLLAALDLGATAGLLQKIYDVEERMQRPIILEEKDRDIQITEENWSEYLGTKHQNAYSGFVDFFNLRISTFGVMKTIDEFIFSPAAQENSMLPRFMGGVGHPFILLGYALEFGNDGLVATALASTCIHDPFIPLAFEPSFNPTSSPGVPVLEILHLLSSSSSFEPIPYPKVGIPFGVGFQYYSKEDKAIGELCSKFHVSESATDSEMQEKIKELVWASVLMLFATGKEGREPRLDFFLMHLVTASLFLQSFVRVLEKQEHKTIIIKAFLPFIISISLFNGRPTIKPELIMAATDKPRPPHGPGSSLHKRSEQGGIGSPLNDEDYNPWSALIEASLYATDSHVLKTMRTLVMAARDYGDTPAGSITGAKAIPGASKLDGSIFVRAAGVLMDYMGWTTFGEKEREDWDRSGLGWDDAWKN